jgi:hypothetical protein
MPRSRKLLNKLVVLIQLDGTIADAPVNKIESHNPHTTPSHPTARHGTPQSLSRPQCLILYARRFIAWQYQCQCQCQSIVTS